MPVHYRALLVVLFLSMLAFTLAKVPICQTGIPAADFDRRRVAWIGATLIAFLAPDFWVFIIGLALLMRFAAARESNSIALYLLAVFAVPGISERVPAFGIVNFLFEIDYARMLSIVVLLPAYLNLRKQPGVAPFGKLLPDKLLAAYLVLMFFLTLTASSFTNSLRAGALHVFLDVFLPYYVASRSLRSRQDFREAITSFLMAAFILSLIGLFEATNRWLLYSTVASHLDADYGYGLYLARGEGAGQLRALATTGQPIPLGFLIAVAMALFWYLKAISQFRTTMWWLGLMLLLGGLIAPLSRGPWVGALAMSVIYIAMGPTPIRNLIKFGMVSAVIAAVVLMASSNPDAIMRLLPFVGGEEGIDHTAVYRQRLLAVSLDLISRNPVFGSFDYILSPEMEALRQGQGIIDIVNTYVAVGLASGLVGLSLFSGFFLAAILQAAKALNTLSDKFSEEYALGRSLVAALVGIVVIIGTVSSITIIPTVYWPIAGFGVAYAAMIRRQTRTADSPDRTSSGAVLPLPRVRYAV